MKLLLALVSTALAIGLVSAAAVAAPASDDKARLFMAYKHGNANSCEVQINFQRRLDDTTTDYKVYNAVTKKELIDMIPYDAQNQPITVVTPSGHGQVGAYQVPNDPQWTYTPIQIDFCGKGKERITKYYIVGTDTVKGTSKQYPDFSLTTPYHYIPPGGPSVDEKVDPVPGKKRTYQAKWTYGEKGVDVKGYYLIVGDKWGKTYKGGEVFADLESFYIDGAKTTTGQFTLKPEWDVERIVLAVSVLDTKGALLSPTNAGEVSIIP